MLTHLYEAIFQRLSALGIPTYLADCVPDGAALPYVAADVAMPLVPGSKGALTLTIWCSGNEPNTLRLSWANALCELLPPRGTYLSSAAGGLTLTLEHPAKCVKEAHLLGLRSVWTLRCYPSHQGGTL